MRLAPNQGTLAFYRIDLMLSLRLVSEARAVAKQIVTPDEARVRLLQASLELAEHGPAGLRAYLQESGTSALTKSEGRDDLSRTCCTRVDFPTWRAPATTCRNRLGSVRRSARSAAWERLKGGAGSPLLTMLSNFTQRTE